ncbi:MAG: sigma 54-interacting transcriptional regulator [Deltaproteobacteria bacterium]|nr:sigma 54-interacting transcriptional regulator [Deltaproteobacteria bacterium]MBN2672376.1 sigma 54-interacting transcriptional regulator [Deltaproteobacteria bacterium]
MPTLSWWPKEGGKKVLSLAKPITTIGSAVENDIVIQSMELADHHAQLVFDGRDFCLNDIAGRGDVRVNSRKKKKAKLIHQDRISLGNAELLFNLMDGSVIPEEKDAATDLEGLKKLQQFSQALLDKNSVDELLEVLMDSVIELTGAAKGFLILFEDETPIIKVARNLRRENLGSAVSQLSDSIVAQVVQTRAAIIVSDAQSHNKFANAQSVINLKLNSVMCAPLLSRGQMLGLIYVGNDTVRGLFEMGTLELLKVFASQASLLVQNAVLLDELKLKNVTLSKELEQQRFGQIIGSSVAMEKVFKKVEKVAVADVSVLVSGETGTGKELIAHEIHRRSGRANGPFITVNCGAIPETLMESEFFGHVKGAFTGADATKEGKFQAANDGTIFLDEIGEMPLSLQVKLLRVLQEHQVMKVGATKTETLNIRVVAATNRDLEAEIQRGNFREDLYYRLNVIHIDLPPLRDRGDDVMLLSKYLLKKYCEEFTSKVKGFTPGAMAAIKKHHWPGNVRELENRLKKAIILCDSNMLGQADLDLTEDTLPSVMPLAEAREEFQRKYVLEILDRNNGNRTKTAEELDVDPRTIYRYLEKA